MKRFYCLILCLILSVSFNVTTLAADSTESSTIIEVLDDGSYIETTIETDTSINLFAATSTKTGRKTIAHKEKSGRILWSVTVNGKFSYNGTSAKCTSSTISTSCPISSWKLSNKSASRSGATATASAVARRYKNGSVAETLKRSVSLTCSNTGKLY